MKRIMIATQIYIAGIQRGFFVKVGGGGGGGGGRDFCRVTKDV